MITLSRHFKQLSCLVVLVFGLVLVPRAGLTQTADDGYYILDAFGSEGGLAGAVTAIAVQPDGKAIIGGLFPAEAQTNPVANLVRLNADGTADTSFSSPGPDSYVNSIAVQTDGRIIIGGAFANLGSSAISNLARLNADGSIDLTFHHAALVNNAVAVVLIQPDGKIVVGGYSTAVGGFGIARLNADGSADSTFNATVGGIGVAALALQPDGKIVVGGDFTLADGQSRSNLVRFNSDGNLDMTFNPAPDSRVNALALQPDGKMVVGGHFGTIGGLVRSHLARLKSNGNADVSFIADANDDVNGLVLQPDGKVVAIGNFTTVTGQAHSSVARLNVDSSLDTAFDTFAGLSASPVAIAIQSDGKFLIGGDFVFSYSCEIDSFGCRVYDLIRANADGTGDTKLITSFDSDGLGVFALAIQPDGKLLVGGQFVGIEGYGVEQAQESLARLNGDGSPDPSLNGDRFPDSPKPVVLAIAVLPSGELVIGGGFETTNNSNNLAWFQSNGVLDTAFAPSDFAFCCSALAPQPDGKLVVNAGNPIRLNADGSQDATFFPFTNGNNYALALQPDGKIVVGGSFTAANGQSRNNLARFNGDGTLDVSFKADVARVIEGLVQTATVYAVCLQPDGKILVAGQFNTIGGQTRNNIARLNSDGSVDSEFDPNADQTVNGMALQLNGQIVLAGQFSTINGNLPHQELALINADGSADQTFTFNVGALDLAIQADGKLVMGGVSELPTGEKVGGMIRLRAPQAALQSLTLEGSTVAWMRSGSGPELSSPPQLQLSLDGNTFAPVGIMQRINGGWQYTGFVAPFDQNFYLRTSGSVSSGIYFDSSSSGLVQSTRQFFISDIIFADGFE